MGTAAKVTWWVLAVVGIVLALAVGSVLVVANSSWGRERARTLAVEQTNAAIDGHLRIGAIEGNLLSAPVLRDVSLVDAEDRPFVEAERVTVGYSLLGLLRQRIVLTRLELEGARVVLDEVPGEDWNFVRIFDTGGEPEPDPPEPGWGDWVEIRDVRMIDGRVTLRMVWEPDESLPPAERREERRRALAGETMDRVVEVPEGLQRVLDFRELDGEAPRILAAHPDTADVVVELGRLSAVAEPFRTPPAVVEDLSGDLRIGQDTLSFADVGLEMPASRLSAEGTLDLESGEGLFRVDADPVELADLRVFSEALPGDVRGDVEVTVRLTEEATRIAAEGVDLEVRDGSVTGTADVSLGEVPRIHAANLRFSEIDTRFLEDIAPDLELARHGVLGGHVSATEAGGGEPGDGPAPLDVDALVRFDDEAAGESRVLAAGRVEPSLDESRVAGLTVRLDPLEISAVRALAPDLLVEGTVEGEATLDGPLSGPLRLDASFLHHDPVAGVSRLGAAGAVDLRDELRLVDLRVAVGPARTELLRYVVDDPPLSGTLEAQATLDGRPSDGLDVRARLLHEDGDERSILAGEGRVATAGGVRAAAELEIETLSLATVGRFAPAAGLRGTARGRIGVEGSLGDLALDARLELPGDAALQAEARLDLEGEDPVYDVAAELERVNLAALSDSVGDTTSIGGTVAVEGRGVDPETAGARLTADLSDDGDPAARRAILAEVTLEEGLLRAESVTAEWGDVSAHADGTFGLSGDVEGTLEYRVAVDSLRTLAAFLPDPGEEEPGAADVSPELEGTFATNGTVRGNLDRMEVDGELTIENLYYAGHEVESASADYAVRELGTSEPTASLSVEANDLFLAGREYERMGVGAGYRGELATEPPPSRHLVDVAFDVRQDEHTEIRIAGGAEVAGSSGELALERLALDVGDGTYRLRAPAAVRWSDESFEIRDLVLEEDGNPVLLADGLIPRSGDGDLELRLDGLEIAHALALFRAETEPDETEGGTTGRVDLELRGGGRLASPVFEGEAAVSNLVIDGRSLPDTEVRWSYADRELTGDGLVVARTGETMLSADATLPLDLAFVDAESPRLLDGPIRLDARIDDLALESLPALTDQVEDLAGRADGSFSVRGTFDEPEMEGSLTAEIPTMFVRPLGIRVADVAAALTLEDDVLRVDSMVAHSRGSLRAGGEVALPREGEPSFELEIDATDLRVMNTEDVQMRVDADLAVGGPYEAVEVTGEVRTRSGVIHIPETEELATAGPLDLEDPELFQRVGPELTAVRDSLIERAPLFENLRVDIDAHIDRDVWLRSTEANIEIFTPPEIGPLNVQMTGLSGHDVRLEGTVHTDRGEYEFMGRRFDLSRGSVIFSEEGDLNPLIRLTAEHEVQLAAREPFDVRIIVDGRPTSLDTELESTAQPPLSQTDLLSFVVFGRDAGSLLQQQGSSLSGQGSAGGPLVGAVAARAAQQFATVGFQAVVSEVEAESAQALGLDVLRIQPADVPAEISTGEFIDVLRGTEIEAGSYVTPRLFVSGQARPTFVHPGARVEYQTDHGWVWRLTWRPRYLPAVPTLSERAPDRASVLGSLLFREWRF